MNIPTIHLCQGVISSKTGERIKKWCMAGISVEEVIEMINQATTVDHLREIIKQFPEFRTHIEPIAIQRKEELENNIITTSNTPTNGTEES